MSLIRNIRTFESLGLRDYRLLWLGGLNTSIALWMDQVTRAWLIYALTHSAMQLGLVSAVRGIPLLALGAIAGAVADRYSRKAQIIIAQVANAILNIILAILVLTGHVQPWHVYVTGFLTGTAQAFQQPARQALINDLVGRGLLLNAIALNSAALNVSRSVGTSPQRRPDPGARRRNVLFHSGCPIRFSHRMDHANQGSGIPESSRSFKACDRSIVTQ